MIGPPWEVHVGRLAVAEREAERGLGDDGIESVARRRGRRRRWHRSRHHRSTAGPGPGHNVMTRWLSTRARSSVCSAMRCLSSAGPLKAFLPGSSPLTSMGASLSVVAPAALVVEVLEAEADRIHDPMAGRAHAGLARWISRISRSVALGLAWRTNCSCGMLGGGGGGGLPIISSSTQRPRRVGLVRSGCEFTARRAQGQHAAAPVIGQVHQAHLVSDHARGCRSAWPGTH
jgi:hypothetical protein